MNAQTFVHKNSYAHDKSGYWQKQHYMLKVDQQLQFQFPFYCGLLITTSILIIYFCSKLLNKWRTILTYLIEDTCHRSAWHTSQSANTLTTGKNCRKGAFKPSRVLLVSKSILSNRVQQAFNNKMNISTARFMAWSCGVPTLTYCSVASIGGEKKLTARLPASHQLSAYHVYTV